MKQNRYGERLTVAEDDVVASLRQHEELRDHGGDFPWMVSKIGMCFSRFPWGNDF